MHVMSFTPEWGLSDRGPRLYPSLPEPSLAQLKPGLVCFHLRFTRWFGLLSWLQACVSTHVCSTVEYRIPSFKNKNKKTPH